MKELSGSLSSVFSAQVRQRPDAIAVTDGARSVSYLELASCASAIRAELTALGLGPGDRVGIYLRRSWLVVAAVLAASGQGCTAVPLDADAPEDRLRYMAEDAGVRAVCVESGGPGPFEGLPRVPVRDAAAPPLPPAPRPPDQPHHVIYTSGSTGRPKGVITPESAVLQLFDSARERFSFGPDDAWAWFHSHCFDFSVWEMWGALLHGGRIVVVPVESRQDPRILLDLLHRERVTVLCQVPSMFRYLVWAMERHPRELALRYLVLGGEAIDRGTIGSWLDLTADRCTVINIYGPTETTVFCTCAVVDRAAVSTEGPTNIGPPLAHTRTAVVAADHRPVPSGFEGELWVAGPAIAAGYTGDPRLTAERFRTADLGGGEDRWYRTGDLVRQLEDGSFEYLGRADSQVKIRGFRIELGEIEAVLRTLPGVTDAAVLVHTPSGGEPLITGYLVGQPPPAAELRSHCAVSLPAYMIPARFKAVDQLPHTLSGKLDRIALQEAR